MCGAHTVATRIKKISSHVLESWKHYYLCMINIYMYMYM